ncbi:hypothetical protein GA0070624_0588 [Micromonospora rhizosphaerae]|uniref:Lipoprotein n=1 Tax=Micromonospora rhizosphaerae TaxID=568872 RepID=A0A1C6RD39_9ACTN|nr:hypothetical protein [Micromonospora rhizosphaerae]SCL15008.1 hypothetical protein GA0070624_0588 [Micromonospora rhizosphaerae]
MHAHLRAARRLTGALAIAMPALLAACTADPPTPPPPSATADPVPAGMDAARDELAALAAAALDRHLTARYTLNAADAPDRTIVVTSANDGSWRVDVPAWGLGGTVDISLAATADGLFQCALPSAGRPDPACVRLGDPDDTVPRRLDPRVQHPFTDWLEVLTDRRAPLAVSPATPPSGVSGQCYSVESTSASLNAPLDVGIYCYQPDGTPTAVRAAFGTLTLAGPPGPASATVQLAGPVVDSEPLDSAAPSPADSPSAETP